MRRAAFVLSILGVAAPNALADNATSTPGEDARGLDALTSCSPSASYVMPWNNEEPLAWHCGQLAPYPAPDVAYLASCVPPFDAQTDARIRTIFNGGVSKGRRANVFGIVGDSVSLEAQFLTPLGAGPPLPVVISDDVRAALLQNDGTSIIDFFRAVHAYDALDSFRAPRAAKTGARATWPLERDPIRDESPLDAMVRTLSPAYAIVLFGTNDAQLFIEPLDRLQGRFTESLTALVASLEARGIVPILTTVPRHMRTPSLPDCSAHPSDRSNARLMIQTTIVSDAVSTIARDRHLPLIDLRKALDPLVNHGIATDGTHPTFYPRRLGGGATLDSHGLSCGYNVRTFVTLRALAQVRAAITK